MNVNFVAHSFRVSVTTGCVAFTDCKVALPVLSISRVSRTGLFVSNSSEAPDTDVNIASVLTFSDE